ncbi:MAG: aminopeptidase P family protein [Chloroflexi bacterium]|nr:aminopeptidase P family protein [Chloroflexota bacterium]MCL5074817.1 aminopeptidase P family protein [Chloroflexota bacterium]
MDRSIIERRLALLRRKLVENDLEAILVSQPENRYYLSGFAARELEAGSLAGWLLLTGAEALLLTGFNYYQAACHQVEGFGVVMVPSQLLPGVPALVQEQGVRRLGFESGYLTVKQHKDLEASLSERCDLIPTTNFVEELRMFKDSEEILAIKQAASIADAALQHLISFIKPGMTEQQAAWELEKFVRENGGDDCSFQPIVSAGPGSAVPHATPSDRAMQSGEPTFVDIGARVNGYCSDLTRSFCLGKAEAQFKDIYDLVQQAQANALQGMRPGLTGKQVDNLARSLIDEAGYGAEFGHGLGHGVGLAIHEAPTLGKESGDVLQSGMVVTVEPGVYLPGWGGVRLEDLVLIKEDGVEILTAAPNLMVVET